MAQDLNGTGVVKDGDGRNPVQPGLAEGVSDHGPDCFGHESLVPERPVQVVADQGGKIVAVPAHTADADHGRGALPGNGPAGAGILFPIGLQDPDDLRRLQGVCQSDHVTETRHLGVRVNREDIRSVLGLEVTQHQALGSENREGLHALSLWLSFVWPAGSLIGQNRESLRTF